MEYAFYTIVTFACLIVIYDKMKSVLTSFSYRTIEKVDKDLKVYFDLWWGNGPHKEVQERVCQELQIISVEEDADEVAERVEYVRSVAFQVARKYYNLHSTKDLYRVPVLGKLLQSQEEKEEGYNDELEAYALDYGLKPNEIEAHFARTG